MGSVCSRLLTACQLLIVFYLQDLDQYVGVTPNFGLLQSFQSSFVTMYEVVRTSRAACSLCAH